MFKRASDYQKNVVNIIVDDVPIIAAVNDTVSGAILSASFSKPYRRTVVSGLPRAPYCMMGICFDCLVTIDGIENRQGCLIPVREGMVIKRQAGKREVNP